VVVERIEAKMLADKNVDKIVVGEAGGNMKEALIEKMWGLI